MKRRDAEIWLFERLKWYGVDVYVDGKFNSLRDRMAHVIVTEAIETVTAGQRKGQKETFAAVFERVHGISPRSLVPDIKRQKTTSR